MNSELKIVDLNESKEYENLITGNEKVSFMQLFREGLKNSLRGILWFFFLLAYVETVFHVWAFGKISFYYVLKILMCIPTALILTLFVSFFKEKVNKVVSAVLTGLILLFYIIHILYHAIFQVYLSVEFFSVNNIKIYQYYREIIQGIKDNLFVLLITVIVPVIALVLLNRFKVLKYRKISVKCIFIPFVYLAVTIALICIIVPLYGKEEYSPYDLMKYENNADYSFEELGVTATNEIQIRNLIFPRKVNLEDDDLGVWVYEPVVSTPVTSTSTSQETTSETLPDDTEIIEEIINEIDTSPNILNIDFVSLAENSSDETVAAVSKYMASLEPTFKNEYTGLFKGYNLIFLTCEGFSNIAVDETHTPTLYKLTHEGFVFNNFYNPRTGGSTSDGEFIVTTSLFPTFGGAKNYKVAGQNAMPFSMGNYFNRTYGIQSRAYHDNDYEYYGRDISYPTMGYYYQGVGNGVVIGKHWPESDYEMMQTTLPEYIDDDVFSIYYMTVSGHLHYTFEGNYCAKIHKDEVQDMTVSERCKAYIACQMELDKALEYLLAQLEEKGIADRTVICFTGDHWPYGLENYEFSELLGHEVEPNFELYKSSLILWCGSIKEPIYIDKVCCSMDIVPTLLNLFGFEYDSRLYMGRDILSNTEGFVGFVHKNYFITDKVMYDPTTKTYTNLTEEEVSEDYINACWKTLNNRKKYSNLLMSCDYYQVIADLLGIDTSDAPQNYVPDYSKFTK